MVKELKPDNLRFLYVLKAVILSVNIAIPMGNEQDTLYQPMTEEEILDYVLSTGVKNVTLTGGEPLLRDDIEKVITALAENNLNVEIETNGSIFLDKIRKLHKEKCNFYNGL